jgi:hypothetical protein
MLGFDFGYAGGILGESASEFHAYLTPYLNCFYRYL